MNNIRLEKSRNHDTTMISNYFIDNYMPQANGEFVKIYLYLLRMSNEPSFEFSLSSIADAFNHTEMDVMRGLKYWEKCGLISLFYNEFRVLSSIKIEDIRSDKFVTYTIMESSPSKSEEKAITVTRADNSDSMVMDNPSETATIVPLAKKETKKAKVEFTSEKLEELTSNEDVKQLLYIAQAYLGKTLSPSETNIILYFYDGLGFSTELIEYLIEYCVSNNHKTLRYIESVALAWAEEGIKDVEEAKEYTGGKSKIFYSVLKSFGISGRNIAPSEKDYILRWTKEYNFSLDVILNACNKTISTIHQPSFQYADSILKNWKDTGIKNISDIDNADAAFSGRKKAAPHQVPVTKSKTSYSANFSQRSYDFNELERNLLHRR